MTMVLGFDAWEYLENVLEDEEYAGEVLLSIARFAPAPPLRVHQPGPPSGGSVLEVTADGFGRAPDTHAAEIVADIEAAGEFVSWPNLDAPEGVPPIVLPGGGWDLAGLLATAPMRRLVAASRYCADIRGTDRVAGMVDGRAAELLRVAEKHNLLTLFH